MHWQFVNCNKIKQYRLKSTKYYIKWAINNPLRSPMFVLDNGTNLCVCHGRHIDGNCVSILFYTLFTPNINPLAQFHRLPEWVQTNFSLCIQYQIGPPADAPPTPMSQLIHLLPATTATLTTTTHSHISFRKRDKKTATTFILFISRRAALINKKTFAKAGAATTATYAWWSERDRLL